MGASKRLFNQISEIQENMGLIGVYGGFTKAAAIHYKGEQARKKTKEQQPGTTKEDGTIDWRAIPGYTGQLARSARTFGEAAIKAGYTITRRNEWNLVLKKNDQQHGRVTFNFYWSKNTGRGYTIQTTLDHPKKGRGQLNRKGISMQEAISLLASPRQHTGKRQQIIIKNQPIV